MFKSSFTYISIDFYRILLAIVLYADKAGHLALHFISNLSLSVLFKKCKAYLYSNQFFFTTYTVCVKNKYFYKVITVQS